MKCDGDYEMFYTEKDVRERGDIIGFEKRFIAMPIRNKAIGAIRSGQLHNKTIPRTNKITTRPVLPGRFFKPMKFLKVLLFVKRYDVQLLSAEVSDLRR